MDPIQVDVTETAGHGHDDLKGKRDVALNILRPSVRLLLEIFIEDHELQAKLKHVDDVLQKLSDDPQDIDFSMAQGILESLPLVDKDFRSSLISMNSTSPEDVVRFFDSATQILRYIYNDEYIEKELDAEISWSCMKKEISEALDELGFLRILLLMLGNVNEAVVNQGVPAVAATLAFLFCFHFAPLVGDQKQQATKSSSNLKIALPRVREHIHSELRTLYGNLRSQRDDMDTFHPAKIIDQEVVELFDRLIDNLTKNHISYGHHQMETAIQELRLLRCNLLDVLQEYYSQERDSASSVKEMESLSFSTLSLIIETAYLTYFSHPNSAVQIQGLFPDLMDAVDSLKQQASDIFKNCCRVFPVSSPCVESVTCFIKNLEELIEHKADSIAPLKHQIETYYREMVQVRNFLASGNIAIEQMPNSPIGFFLERFIESANQARFIVDSFLAGESGSLWCHKLAMFVVTNEVKKMKPRVLNKMKASQSDINVHSSLVAENPHKDVDPATSSKDEMKITNSIVPKPDCNKLVGVKDAELHVIELLTSGSTNLKIIAIVGMPGLGKTTLANSVYDHLAINNHFHVRAWCCVSQVYDRETLLRDILSQVAGETNPSLEEVSGDDLALMVYRKLKGRRYLIVVDDIWDIEVWQDLQRTFPNDDNGSRILITTRHRDVAREANSIHYNLSLLSDKNSHKLLLFKVFDRVTCPPKLSNISWRIARNCKGLPLAVVLVAGILRRRERSKESWEQVATGVKSLGGELANHFEIMQLRNILELSYNHLPVGLKPCFLYFAVFQEDTSISVSKLTQLWISEGLVLEENVCHKSLEEKAESYLDELIDRSLVMIAKRSSNGGVKACRIHDVLRDFCLTKSGEEKLMSEESMLGGIIRVHLHSLLYYSIQNEDRIHPGVGRKNVFSEGPVSIEKFHSRRQVRSECDRIYQSSVSRQFDDYFIFQHKFLKVLDLGKVRMGSRAVTSDIIMISTLVHLRFLGIRPRSIEIPAEIGNLRKLETLILTGVIGYIKLPESLWNLPNLRHVLMDHGFSSFMDCSKTFVENFSGLYDLKSVSTLSLLDEDDVGYSILRKLLCIQKLSCRFEYSWDDATKSCVFPVLDFLNQLESLKVFFCGKVTFPCKFSFPSNLKKLSISNSRLQWDAISVIARQLPNLEVLKLLNKAFEGQEWNMGDGDEFPKLKFLKLESLNIKFWNAEAEHFICLEQLVVLSCPELEEIPSCFGEIATLQLIEMKWCSSSAMDSVSQILQTQRDLSNHQFKVSQGGCKVM